LITKRKKKQSDKKKEIDIRCLFKHLLSAQKIQVKLINIFDGPNAPYFFLQLYLELCRDRPIVKIKRQQQTTLHTHTHRTNKVQIIRNISDNKQIRNYLNQERQEEN